MTDTSQSLRDDIAFMRALADEGVRPPLLAGPNLMAAGAIWGLACFAAWVMVRTHAPFQWTSIPFIAAMLVFFVSLPFLIRRAKRGPGGQSPANRAVGMAWSGAGWGIFVLVACTFLVCWRMRTGAPAQMIPSGILILYGAAWTVAAAMTKDRFLWWIAILSYGSAMALAALIDQPDMYLYFTIVLVVVAIIPGFILWRREPKTVV